MHHGIGPLVVSNSDSVTRRNSSYEMQRDDTGGALGRKRGVRLDSDVASIATRIRNLGDKTQTFANS
jgi:hypothetical protein